MIQLPPEFPDILFGAGVSSRTGECASELGCRAFLVTGKSSARKCGALDRVLPSLESAGVEYRIFDAVEPEPAISALSDGAAEAGDFNADMVIGIGGGSPLDAAKGIAVLAVNEGPPQRYFSEEPPNVPLPVVAVPTTAGTGSEVTPYAVIVDTSGDLPVKRTLRTPLIFPKVALVDPELTYSMPASVTADTGMDTLAHALEGCLCTKRSLATSCMGMEAIRMVLRHLRQACDSPQNADARSGMCMAALLAGVVITHTGTELAHRMGYVLTLRFGVPHGRAIAIIMPHVVRLYSPCDALGWICKSLGGKGVPDRKTGEFIAREIEELITDVGIESSLGRNVSDKEISSCALEVVSDERKMTNCSRRPSLEELKTIFTRVVR